MGGQGKPPSLSHVQKFWHSDQFWSRMHNLYNDIKLQTFTWTWTHCLHRHYTTMLSGCSSDSVMSIRSVDRKAKLAALAEQKKFRKEKPSCSVRLENFSSRKKWLWLERNFSCMKNSTEPIRCYPIEMWQVNELFSSNANLQTWRYSWTLFYATW